MNHAIRSIQSKHLKNNQEGVTTSLCIEFERSPNAIGGGNQLYTSSSSNSNSKNPPLPETIDEREIEKELLRLRYSGFRTMRKMKLRLYDFEICL